MDDFTSAEFTRFLKLLQVTNPTASLNDVKHLWYKYSLNNHPDKAAQKDIEELKFVNRLYYHVSNLTDKEW